MKTFFPAFTALGLGTLSPLLWACSISGLKNQLIFEVEPTKIHVRHDLNYADIQKQADIPPPTGMPGAFVGGFTRTETRTSATVTTHIQPTQNKHICASATIHLKITQPTATVFLPKEEPQGGCRYQVTYTHEMRHVAIFQRGLRKVLQSEGATLRHLIESTPPTRHADEKAAQAYFKKVMEMLTLRLQHAIKRQDEDQKILDTVDNYRHEAQKIATCEQRRSPPTAPVSPIVLNLPQHPPDPKPLIPSAYR